MDRMVEEQRVERVYEINNATDRLHELYTTLHSHNTQMGTACHLDGGNMDMQPVSKHERLAHREWLLSEQWKDLTWREQFKISSLILNAMLMEWPELEDVEVSI